VLSSNGWHGKNTQEEFIQWLDGALEDLYRVTNTHDAHTIKEKLSEILPEYPAQPEISRAPECQIKDVKL